MKQTKTYRLVLSAFFLALALVLPFLTGQLPEVGAMLCPMHFPALLTGFFCGAPWGAAVGFVAPLLRSALFGGRPPMFPTAVCMAFELAAYGAVAGWLHRVLPRRKSSVYCALLSAMVLGRLVWGAVSFICTGLNPSAFGFAAFWAGAVVNALPGIAAQIVIVPLLVIVLNRQQRRQ